MLFNRKTKDIPPGSRDCTRKSNGLFLLRYVDDRLSSNGKKEKNLNQLMGKYYQLEALHENLQKKRFSLLDNVRPHSKESF